MRFLLFYLKNGQVEKSPSLSGQFFKLFLEKNVSAKLKS